ncbi:inner membrane protein [Escherichia coli]|uniref:Inner membrane protein n=1 Tax=Escherichia coli TaxID=562 RepID=A0A376TMC1_ECOLX|nr:inner membrane protein [Escherichia coli]
MHILDSLLAFSAYFFIGVAMVIIFLFIYSKLHRTTNGNYQKQ